MSHFIYVCNTGIITLVFGITCFPLILNYWSKYVSKNKSGGKSFLVFQEGLLGNFNTQYAALIVLALTGYESGDIERNGAK